MVRRGHIQIFDLLSLEGLGEVHKKYVEPNLGWEQDRWLMTIIDM